MTRRQGQAATQAAAITAGYLPITVPEGMLTPLGMTITPSWIV